MRLLHFEGDKLRLTDFTGKVIPPYAILSHRWGDEEVLFEDIGDGDGYKKKTAGFEKIQFCARQAARDGLRYFWIDTCCINKWNVQELSREINSMYSRYRDAARCYALLTDVSAPRLAVSAQKFIWKHRFVASEWNRRGWTLQELIAPRSIEFFSKEGRRLGDKASLRPMICDATGIPAKALSGDSLAYFSMQERISWAKNRRTSEPEDEVYCLLGILDVQMPSRYGEGKGAAFKRLQNELELRVDKNTAPWSIPFSRNTRFIGRQAELAELEAMLFQGEGTTMIAITGPGGTGKSQLALEFAYVTKAKYTDCSILWVDASDNDSLRQSFTDIAQKLAIPGWNGEAADIGPRVCRYLSSGDAPRWLLVFDNADDGTLEPHASHASSIVSLAKYLPQSVEKGSIVFTTTHSVALQRLTNQNVITLGALESNTARTMLETALDLSSDTSADTSEDIASLLDDLSNTSLAITLAAAYMTNTGTGIREYRRRLLQLQQDSFTGPVAMACLLSIQAIHPHYSLAAEYLYRTACVNRKDIPEEILTEEFGAGHKAAMQILESYALVTRQPAKTAIDLHPLVHLAVRDWLKEQGLLLQQTRKAMNHLLEVFPVPDPDEERNVSKWRRLQSHVRYVLSSHLIEQDDKTRSHLAWSYATALRADGLYGEAEPLLVQLVERSKRLRGDEDPDTLMLKSSLAATYYHQGRLKDAEELEVEVLGAKQRVLGEDHESTLTGIDSLATTYLGQGRLKKTEELQIRAVEARKRVLGEEDPTTLACMNHLSRTYYQQGRLNEAEKLQTKVVEMQKRVRGEDHPETLHTRSNLATTYAEQGRLDDAEEQHAQLVETWKRVFGEDHPDTLTSISNLAVAIQKQERFDEAAELQQAVFEMRKRVLGEAHPHTLITMANLAGALRRTGRLGLASELMSSCAWLSRTGLGPEHPHTIARERWSRAWKAEAEQVAAVSIVANVVDEGENNHDIHVT